MNTHPSRSLYLLLVVIFFPIGFWAGRQISLTRHPFQPVLWPLSHLRGLHLPARLVQNNIAQAGSPSLAPTAYPSPAQTNVLLLFVDDLKAPRAELIGAWLLVYPHDSRRLILLPIFQEHDPEEELVTSFRIEEGKLSGEFLRAVERRNLLWHSFLLLDRETQKAVMRVPGEEAPPSLTFLHWVCEQLPRQPQLLRELKPLVSERLISDLDLATSLDLWQFHLTKVPNLTCEFPTLSP